ncbi:hypothetical protein AB205_0046640 [Aquarana catesbeiana]|uniref:Uncharacterized protein n=1 Tax=Aquarana catesbeiana TaxID=8400 RepID=A0A2G9NC84_AQUCT|nr:hypothetical protein AB205_0046640 [Aquarana catesbeiana]
MFLQAVRVKSLHLLSQDYPSDGEFRQNCRLLFSWGRKPYSSSILEIQQLRDCLAFHFRLFLFKNHYSDSPQ